MKDRKTFPVAAHGKINRVTTYGEKIGYNDEHSTTLISSMKIAIKDRNTRCRTWKPDADMERIPSGHRPVCRRMLTSKDRNLLIRKAIL